MNAVTIETERLVLRMFRVERFGESLEGGTEVMGMPVLIYGIDRDKA